MTVHAANEGESSQGVLVGSADGTIRLMASTGAETPIATLLTPAIGGKGWNHCYEYTVEYSSQAPVTLTMLAADSGNGSYGPAAITLPGTGGVPTKLTAKFGANKFQWAWFLFSFTDPAFQLYLQGFVVAMKPWGGQAYEPVLPFASSGGEGGQS
jgi:hypothetical protein